MTVSNRMRGALIAAAGAMTLMAGAAQAQGRDTIDVNADGRVATRSQIVQVADINTAVPAGQARLDMRLRVAARTVCQDSGMWGLRPPKDFTRCYDNAVADARAQAGAQRQAMAGGGTIRVIAR